MRCGQLAYAVVVVISASACSGGRERDRGATMTPPREESPTMASPLAIYLAQGTLPFPASYSYDGPDGVWARFLRDATLGEKLVDDSEVASYRASPQQFVLTTRAGVRIRQRMGQNSAPLNDQPFIVVLNGQRLYAGRVLRVISAQAANYPVLYVDHEDRSRPVILWLPSRHTGRYGSDVRPAAGVPVPIFGPVAEHFARTGRNRSLEPWHIEAQSRPLLPELRWQLEQLSNLDDGSSTLVADGVSDVSGLVGMTRRQIGEALRPPGECHDLQPSSGGTLEHRSVPCETAREWTYAFYRRRGPGGGRELRIRFASDDTCRAADFVHTQ